jgi:hypothetical protein
MVYVTRTGSNKVTIPAISHLLNWAPSNAALVFVSGFHGGNAESAWSTMESSMIVSARRQIFLTCNYLRPGESRTVTIDCEGVRQTIRMEHAGGCYQVEIGKEYPTMVHFKADGALTPLVAGMSNDPRSLAFEVWFALPMYLYVANLPESALVSALPVIYCVFDSKKEEDTLKPIYAGLLAKGWPIQMLNAAAAVKQFKASGAAQGNFLLATSHTYSHLFNGGCRGRFMYTEHGASPLKVYTYNTHYLRYDLILLPGDLWVNRLKEIYPQLAGACHSVGYAKLKASRLLSAEERFAVCQKLNVDPEKKLVLFAPSWSGSNRDRGIFNVNAFDKSTALVTIPHDGDNKFVAELQAQGHNIYVLTDGESISDYYSVADVLISDVSSTAVEFTALGKPALCLTLDRIPDFDPRFQESESKLRIPHTDRYWDFCKLVPREQINAALADLLAQGTDAASSDDVPGSVEDMLRCYGTESVELNVQAIAKFLLTPALSSQEVLT